MRLHIIVGSTRPGRAGLAVGRWIHGRARAHEKFEATLVDLAEVNLPILDEPAHPKLRAYEHAHTKRWSETIAAADAFVFVTPEYNYFAPPALVNALDYLFAEWAYKPAAFVSYGGVSGGLRAVQSLKLLLTALKMMPIPEAVTIPFFNKQMEAANAAFKGGEPHDGAAATMLNELHRWATALKTLR